MPSFSQAFVVVRRRVLPALVAAAAVLSIAHAQEADRPRAAEWLRRADADGDGKVTKAEFIKARTGDLEDNFSRLDANGNGILDEAEAERAIGMMRGAGVGREGGRRPEGGPRPQGGPPGGRGTGEEMDGLFQRMDRDGDGKLSREEFAAGMTRLREMMQQRGGGLPGQAAGRPGGPEEGFRRPPRPESAEGSAAPKP
jgi:Ca2+-binding EF-hand superfamily protein